MGIYKDLFLNAIPERYRLPAWYYVKKYTGSLDREIAYFKAIFPRNKAMIDIGANIGIYSYAFESVCSQVYAFEPQSSCVRTISSIASKKIQVYQIALSNRAGLMTLHVPYVNGSLLTGLASLNTRPKNSKEETVQVATLDSFNLTDIGLIKIDVEGHEMEVLEGAIETIIREMPLIQIEIEQRHSSYPINEIFEKVIALGYRGGFLVNNKYHSLSEFSYEKYQAPFIDDINAERYGKLNGKYICNFIFQPDVRG